MAFQWYIVALIFIFLLVLWWFCRAVKSEKSKWYWNLARLFFLIGAVWFLGSLLGMIPGEASFAEWRQERQLFWGRLAQELTESPDLRTAAEVMLSPAVTEEVRGGINGLLRGYKFKWIVFMAGGTAVLAGAAGAMLLKHAWRWRALIVIPAVIAGLLMLGYGSWNYVLGERLQRSLESLYHTQRQAMEELRELMPDLSNSKIIPLVREHADWREAGEQFRRLIDRIDGEKQ